MAGEWSRTVGVCRFEILSKLIFIVILPRRIVLGQGIPLKYKTTLNIRYLQIYKMQNKDFVKTVNVDKDLTLRFS